MTECYLQSCLVISEYNNGNILYHWEKFGYHAPLENNIFVRKEGLKSGKNQIKVG